MGTTRFVIHTEDRKRYLVNEEDDIIRTDMQHTPSGNWKALGVVEILPFGRVGELQTLESVVGIDMRYKNGRGRFRLVDLDHSTKRIWGIRVVGIDIIGGC